MPTIYPPAADSPHSTSLPGATVDQISNLTVEYFDIRRPESNIVDSTALSECSVEQINAIGSINPDQVKVLQASQLTLLTTDADKVNALRIEYLSPNNLYPDAEFPLAPGHIEKLTIENLNKLTTIQIKKFNQQQTQAIPVDILPSMSSSKISSFTPEQFKHFTVDQISALTTTDTYHIQALSTQQLAALTVLSSNSVNQVGALSPSQLVAMTEAQIQAFTTTPTNQVAQLKIGGMGSDNFAKFSNDQITALTESQVSLLESNYSTYFTYLSSVQISAFTAGNILRWGTNIASVLSETQLQSLKEYQIKSPLPRDIIQSFHKKTGDTVTRNVKFHPDQMKWLSADQMLGFLPEQIETFTQDMTAAISAIQLTGLTSPAYDSRIKSFKVQYFNTNYDFPFSSAQVKAMSDNQMPNITPEHIARLTQSQVTNINPHQLTLLTHDQMKKLSNGSVRAITKDQVKAFNVDSTGNAKRKLFANGLFVSQFWELDDTVKAYLKNDGTDGNEGGSNIMDSADNHEIVSSIQGLYANKNSTAVQEMSYSSTQAIRLTYLKPTQLMHLTNAQLTAILNIAPLATLFCADNLAYFKKNILTLDSAATLTVDSIKSDYPSVLQLSALTSAIARNASFSASLTADLINKLSTEQLLSLNSNLIPVSAISGLSIDTLHKFTRSYVESMTRGQIREFSQSHLQDSQFVALIASSSSVSISLTPISGASDGGQVGYIPQSAYKNTILQNRSVAAPMNFAMDILSCTANNLTQLEAYTGDSLAAYTAKINIDMLTSNLREFITYKIVGNSTIPGQGELRFYVDSSKFKPKSLALGSSYNNIKWGSCQVENNVNGKSVSKDVVSVDFMKYCYTCKNPDEVDATTLYWNNSENVKNAFTTIIETVINSKVSSVIDPVKINSNDGSLTLIDENNNKYTLLSGAEEFGGIANLPSKLYTHTLAQQPHRIKQNTPTDSKYPFPFVTGDKMQFTFTIVANSANAVNNVIPRKTYLVEITAADP